MNQLPNRGLRQRRPPKSFDSENQDADPWGYAKPSYQKDMRNPSQLLNSDAKLFIKFVNSINKSCRSHQSDNRKKEIQSIKQPLPLRQRKAKITETVPQSQKKQTQQIKENKADPNKKAKQSFNFKEHINNLDIPTLSKNDSFLSKIKTMSLQSANKMLNIELSYKHKTGSIDSNKVKIQKMQMAAKKIQQSNPFKKNGNQNANQFNFQTSNLFFAADKQKQNKISQIQQKLGIQRPTIAENKIFKRSAYHVAIAYHIYIKKLKEKGPIGVEIDPTFYARKLKEDMKKGG